MEKKFFGVVKKSLFMMFAAALILVFSSASAKAEEGVPGFSGKYSSTWLTKTPYTTYYSISNYQKGDKIVSVKSSNPGVATVKKGKLIGINKPAIVMTPKKAGKTKLTCVVKRGGKKYTTSTTLLVVNYKNPLKSFKLDGKEYASKLKNNNTYYTKLSGQKTVTVTATKDWVVAGFYRYPADSNFSQFHKSGDTIDLNGATQLSVSLHSKKNKNLFLSVHLLVKQKVKK
ncbi:MAG: hypothetical protein K6G06_05115 [Butyrivibrio sp.]|nr:hypothetical protein [Butyrivibrio sp.]